jgi:hypothetical protein
MRWMMMIAVAAGFGATACAARADPEPTPSIIDLFARADTLPPLGDSVPLRWVSMDGCRGIGEVVLNTPEDVARQRERPDCADLPADLDLSNRTIVGVATRRDCSGSSFLRAYRVESEQVIRVVETWRDGGSRAMCLGPFRWVAMPKLPPGWSVDFVRRRLERDQY